MFLYFVFIICVIICPQRYKSDSFTFKYDVMINRFFSKVKICIICDEEITQSIECSLASIRT